MNRRYDVLALGRSSIDLYANDIGAPFVDIKSFAVYVGGCPTNISVGTRRLGLRTALLNPVGEDLVGDLVLKFLEGEGVDTRFSRRKPGRRTSAFLLGIEPPDKFSLVPYRDNCPDLELTIDDVLAAPIADARALLITGTGLSRQPSRDATLFAAEQAKSHGTQVILDLDFRLELWTDARTYGIAVRSALPLVDVVIGTLDEVTNAFIINRTDPPAAHLKPDALKSIEAVLKANLKALIMKRGGESTVIYLPDGETLEAQTFPVQVLNVLGAGDAFASGFLYGHLKGWDWYKSARMGNACGAIVVTRHGCANFMPYENEVLTFIEERGGF
ncbi:MAG: 5-dehydro-2-deoxygluconokinase [Pyrinomonadaceae bacterium MAG19_C2-C3]|nr:5-dehydro-2-deoxygluconokinase [Pyrinomonadaceae bacterium MAG19_C2-C3]